MQQTLRKQVFGSRFGLTPIRHRCAINVASARHIVKNAARILGPSFFMVLFAVVAHAQAQDAPGTINFGAVTGVAGSVITVLKFVGAAMAVGGLIFAAFEFFGRHDIGKAVGGLVGALVGGIIIGAASGWGQSLAGSMTQQSAQ